MSCFHEKHHFLVYLSPFEWRSDEIRTEVRMYSMNGDIDMT